MASGNKKAPRPGNIYAFCIGDGHYAFARLVLTIPKAFDLVQIFEHVGESELDFSAALSSPLVIPYNVIFLNVMTGRPFRWSLVGFDERFQPEIEDLNELEIVLGICQVSKFDPEFTPNEDGRKLWTEIRTTSLEEYNAIKHGPLSKNRALDPGLLFADLRERWRLEPWTWTTSREMYQWFSEHGICNQ